LKHLQKTISDVTVLVPVLEIGLPLSNYVGSIAKVYTRVSRMGTKSFTFECVIAALRDRDAKEITIAAHSLLLMRSFDAKTGKVSGEVLPACKRKNKIV